METRSELKQGLQLLPSQVSWFHGSAMRSSTVMEHPDIKKQKNKKKILILTQQISEHGILFKHTQLWITLDIMKSRNMHATEADYWHTYFIIPDWKLLLQHFHKMVKTQVHVSVKPLRTDNAREYVSSEIVAYLQGCSIELQNSCAILKMGRITYI